MQYFNSPIPSVSAKSWIQDQAEILTLTEKHGFT